MDPYESSPGPGGEDSQGGRSGDPIMGNLPKSRPQRTTRRPPSPPPREHDPDVKAPADGAPGLPRLALDGAIEMAKLPVKVGVNITFRALDAVAEALRRR